MRNRLIEILERRQIEAKTNTASMNEGFGAWYADALIAAGVILPKYRIGEASVEEDGDGIRYWFRGVKQEGVNRDAVVKIEKYYEWLKGFSIEKEITTVTREIIPIE